MNARQLTMVALCGLGFLICGCKDDADTTIPDKSQKPVAEAAPADVAKEVARKAWAYFDASYNKKQADPQQAFMETWGPDINPACTSIVMLGGLRTGMLKPDDQRVADTMQGLLAKQQPTGAFDLGQGFRAVYVTSFCVELMSWLRDHGSPGLQKAVKDPVARAMAYLKQAQVGNPDGPMPDAKADSNIAFGGWAYSAEELKKEDNLKKPAANMSTSIFALDAAAAFGVPKDDPLWSSATTFLTRSHNAAEAAKGIEIKTRDGKRVVDPPAGHTSHGGARYSPDSTMATPEAKEDGSVILTSYGSMTYALLRGYLHAGLRKDDPKVQLAWRWLRHNFTVEHVPGFTNTEAAPSADKQGYYYQFMQMARTMALFGEGSFEDGKGNKRDWQAEMTRKVAALQKPDGSFTNDHDRWNEGFPPIAGGYILNALGEIIK